MYFFVYLGVILELDFCFDSGIFVNGRRYGSNFGIRFIVIFSCDLGYILSDDELFVCERNY